jgi:pilus assembly protein CpaF
MDSSQSLPIEFLSEAIRKSISEKVKHDFELSDIQLRDRISSDILENEHTKNLDTKTQYSIMLRVFDSIRRFDVIQKFMDDDSVTEIMINCFDEIYIERFGVVQLTTERFDSPSRYEEFIHSTLSKYNKSVNELSPIVDVRIESGSRLNVVFPPISTKGPALTIRKFATQHRTLEDYVNLNFFPREILGYLKWTIEQRKNIFISGGTGSGKTSLLNALLSYVDINERVVIIEDTREINMGANRNVVHLETRQYLHSPLANISMSDLIRTSLRMRPNRIIVGEVRGKEGSMSTGHSNSPHDLFSRLETMALADNSIPHALIRKLIASAIQVIIHLTRDIKGQRILGEICEVHWKDDAPIFETIYQNTKELTKHAA